MIIIHIYALGHVKKEIKTTIGGGGGCINRLGINEILKISTRTYAPLIFSLKGEIDEKLNFDG